MENSENRYKIVESVFFPTAKRRRESLLNSETKFVHYTNANTALSILESKAFWMRNAKCMNDWSEIVYGIDVLRRAIFQKTNIVHVIGETFGIDKAEFVDLFNEVAKSVANDCYVASFSEHRKEDTEFGRLSMWRAYGEPAGSVALVMNTEPFFSETNVLQAYSSPVEYGGILEISNAISEISDNIMREKRNIALSKDEVKWILFRVLVFAVASIKHKAFNEEREWRVIHLPKIEPSRSLNRKISSVKGVPQEIYMIPLRHWPSTGYIGTDISVLISEILVGPSMHPDAISGAFVAKLKECKVSDAESRVKITRIPLRN